MIVNSSFTSPRAHRIWSIALGALMVIVGVLSLATPVVTSISLTWILGVLFFVSGIVQLVHAIQFIRYPGSVSRLLLATLSIVAGILVLRNPIGGMMGLTLALTFFLLVSAVGKFTLGMEWRPKRGAAGLFVSSLISLALGIFLIFTFPINSFIVPGIVFGVDMLFFGVALIASAWLLETIPAEEILYENAA